MTERSGNNVWLEPAGLVLLRAVEYGIIGKWRSPFEVNTPHCSTLPPHSNKTPSFGSSLSSNSATMEKIEMSNKSHDRLKNESWFSDGGWSSWAPEGIWFHLFKCIYLCQKINPDVARRSSRDNSITVCCRKCVKKSVSVSRLTVDIKVYLVCFFVLPFYSFLSSHLSFIYSRIIFILQQHQHFVCKTNHLDAWGTLNKKLLWTVCCD